MFLTEQIQVEYIDIDMLKPYKNNARKHSEQQVAEIADSIKRYGFNTPVAISSNYTIIAGHGRVAALKLLGERLVPCVKLVHLDKDTLRRGYTIADNKLALKSDWDFGLLKIEFEELKDMDFDPEFTYFTPDEIEAILNPEVDVLPAEGDDDVPELQKNPISKLGDVWLLGDHRLMCGDSTNPLHVTKLYAELKPILMLTDPPYGVKYDPEWRDGADLGVGERSRGKVLNDDRVDWTEAYALFTGDIAYVWHAGKFTHVVAKNLEDLGYSLISQIIWAKQHFALSRGDYHWQHEPCWYAVKKGVNHNWQGKRDQATLWEIKNNNAFGNANAEATVGHGTQKPLECMLRPIMNNTKPGDVIYDPFCGSGTTLIACEKTERICLAMELSPEYCDVIVKRFYELTKVDAILEATGELYRTLESGKKGST